MVIADWSGGLIKGGGLDGLGQGFPAVDLAHLYLAESEQRPEQHRNGLGFYAPAEFLVQALDGDGGGPL